MDFPDNSFLLKTLTVVSGPDMVDLTFHNFVSYKENVGKVPQGQLAWGWALGRAWTSSEAGLGREVVGASRGGGGGGGC